MAWSHRDGLPVPGRGRCRRGRARAMPVITGLGSDIMMIDSRSQSPSLDCHGDCQAEFIMMFAVPQAEPLSP